MTTLINNDLLGGYVHYTLFVLLTLFNELGHTRLENYTLPFPRRYDIRVYIAATCICLPHNYRHAYSSIFKSSSASRDCILTSLLNI